MLISVLILMVFHTSVFATDSNVSQSGDTSFITEWRIPVDADEVEGTTTTNASGDEVTLGPQTTITLPIPTHTSNNYTVDWGDGSAVETFDSTADFPTHTYENTEETTYTIKITGKVNIFGHTANNVPNKVGTYSQYYAFTQYLTGLKSWGEIGATQYGFSNCSKLSSTIPESTEKSFENITSLRFLFYNCTNLTGGISGDLFKNTANVIDSSGIFSNCSGLTGSIPENLFKDMINTKSFSDVFMGCSNLTGSIPADLFKNTKLVNNFSCTFKNCSQLSGEIPENLFATTELVTSFYHTFFGCSKLEGSIPANLFGKTTLAKSFQATFANCSGLTGSIPAELFAKTTEANNFNSTFQGCSKLEGSIPAELFAKTTKANDFYSTFSGCTKLSGNIPKDLFKNTPDVTSFCRTFYGCSSLEGEIPADLFLNNNAVKDFSYTFFKCNGLSGSIPSTLFSNKELVESFAYTFRDCNNLSGSIPAELFADTKKVNTFAHTFYGCTNLEGSIPGTLFKNTPEVTSFDSTFYECSGLSGEIPAELFEKTVNITTYYQTFMNCSSISGEISEELFDSNVAITEVPSEFKGFNTEDAFYRTFSGCSNLTSVNMNTLYIGYGMFSGCNNIIEITIGENVQAIGTNAFRANIKAGEEPINTILRTSNSVATSYNWLGDNRKVIDVSTFTTEWRIPVDADEVEGTTTTDESGETITVGPQTTIILPIPIHANNNYTVDWGDGSALETFDSTADFPAHTYENTEETTYTIKIAGKVNSFGYYIDNVPQATGTYANYYTFTQYLTGLKQWGELGATRYGFSNCTKLSGTIPSPTENSFKSIKNMSYLFSNCSNLTGSIPSDLFSNAENLEILNMTFNSCINLTGDIPAELFENTLKVKDISWAFHYCTALSGGIPAGLFANMRELETCAGVFCSDPSIGEQIPANLFENNLKLKDVSWTFAYIPNYTGTIPLKLFSGLINLENASYLFYRSTGVTGELPSDFFKDSPNIINFNHAFSHCYGLGGEITQDFFGENSALQIPTNFPTEDLILEAMFKNCYGITKVDIDLPFIGMEMFYGCNELTEITIGDNVQAIGTDAFEAVDPYNASNLLTTKLSTKNSVATNYNWNADNRNMTDATPLITEWTIPVDGDKVQATTGTPATTIVLPIPTHSSNNYTVDWGDESGIQTFDSSANFPTHKYENTSETKYTIKIKGTVNSFGYYTNVQPQTTGAYSTYYTFTQYLTGLIQWGELEATRYGFSACINLNSTIPSPTAKSFEKATSMECLFWRCSKLAGEIPEDLFSNATNVTSFVSTFNGCSSLTGSIPEGLFEKTPEVLSFVATFNACSSLTGNIPAKLFKNTPKVTTFNSVFSNLSTYNGTIPAELFANTTEVIDVSWAFAYNTQITGDISPTLFAKMEKLENAEYIFYRCMSLTGEIPNNLFANSPNVKNFDHLFSHCTGLGGAITKEFFANNVHMKNPETFVNPNDLLEAMFKNCAITSLDYDLPIIATEMFYGCNKLTDITIGNNVQSIDSIAFTATSSYSASNLLATNLTTENSVVTNYNWTSDNRQIGLKITNETLITEWTIPVDGDKVQATTGTPATTIILPITASEGNNYVVDWGDGKIGVFKNSEGNDAFPTHTYTNTEETKYTIKIKGTVNSFGYYGDAQPKATGTYAMYYTFTQYLTGLIQWGELEATRYGFSYCTKLGSTIPSPTGNSFINVNDVSYLFYNCTSLTGSIPEDLFKNASKVIYINEVFTNCSKIEGSIPEDLFKDTIETIQFYHTFYNCTGLTGSIPENLFKNTTKVKNYDMVFRNCTGLTGSIPKDLFKNAYETLNFYGVFMGCNNLSGSIPESLFASATKAKMISDVFNSCYNLTGTIPEKLFANNLEVEDFYGTFLHCHNITGPIPAKLFANNQKVKSFQSIFMQCHNLSGEIPPELFVNNPEVNTFYTAFWNCPKLTGPIPEGLFANNKKVTNFQYTFGYCEGLTSVPENLFATNTAITTAAQAKTAFTQTFVYSGVSKASVNTIAVGNYMLYGCSNLTDITIGDNVQAIGKQAFRLEAPYGATNLLTTNLETTNEVALRYNWNSDYRAITSPKYFITEWTIPVDADKVAESTGTPGTTIVLPILEHADNSYFVDWGDGNIEVFNHEEGNAAFPTHTYTNTSETKYKIKVLGTVNNFGYYGNITPNAEGEYKNYYTFTQYVTGLIQWGELGIERYGFSNCTKLSGTIPSPTENSFKNVTSMAYLFNNCAKLTGSIPADLFTNAGLVTSFSNTFSACSLLTDSIPAKLFEKNTEAKSFERTFNECHKLSGSIPGELFKNTTKVTNFFSTFRFCTSLTGSIPAELFANTPEVTNFSCVFGLASKLEGPIPPTLFSNTPNVTTVADLFHACTGLTGSIPEGFLDKMTKLENVACIFYNCTGLTGEIPKALFAKAPNISNFDHAFGRSSGLTGEITQEFFGDNVGLKIPANFPAEDLTLEAMFKYCTGITKVDINLPFIGLEMFEGCNNLTEIKLGDKIEIIAPGAFKATSPYSTTNLLATNLETTNEVVMDYNWLADNRLVGITNNGKVLITEWTIPAGTTVKLPIPSSTNNMYKVDWGDGILEVYDNTANFPEHEYTNTETKTYTIKVEGTVDSFGYIGDDVPESTGVNSEYYTFTQYVTKLNAWGEVNATQYGFSQCSKLAGTLPEALGDSFVNLQTVENLFYNCVSLSGNIPEGLFSKATEIVSCAKAFAGCSGLQGSIPEMLLQNNTKLQNATSLFEGCEGLSGSIPTNLFVNNTQLEEVTNLFKDCLNLTGTIPANLFARNKQITSMEGVFEGCSSLSETIPGNLFVQNNEVLSFKNTFKGCEGLSGMVPATLFKNSKATNYESTFEKCINITAGEFTLDTTIVTDMDRMFAGCTKLENIVLGENFKNLTGTNMFENASILKAIIMLNNPETTEDIGTIANFETLGLTGGTIIYVPYLEDEKLYEEVVTNVPDTNISQVIRGVQPHPDYVGVNEEYIEEGYTVAGYSMDGEESNKWKQYGFYVKIEGIPVKTDKVGSEWVRYVLRR